MIPKTNDNGVVFSVDGVDCLKLSVHLSADADGEKHDAFMKRAVAELGAYYLGTEVVERAGVFRSGWARHWVLVPAKNVAAFWEMYDKEVGNDACSDGYP